MRNQRRRRLSLSTSFDKRVLQVSQETVRTLTSEELSQVATGCPTGSSPPTQQTNGGSIRC